jgi:hypothetical protein
MATRILIDGYNFLWQDRLFRDEAIRGHDKGRTAVLEWLAKRPQLKAFDVSVVFDAYKTDASRPTNPSTAVSASSSPRAVNGRTIGSNPRLPNGDRRPSSSPPTSRSCGTPKRRAAGF